MATPRDLITEFIRLRDELSEKKAEFKKIEDQIRTRQAQISGELQQVMGQLGVDSLKTPSGTAYLTEKVSVLTSDKEKFLDYIQKNNAWELLDIRGSKTAIQEYALENNDLPPGIELSRFQDVGIRRA